ncbi:MAG: hypothetical protein ACK5L3_05810 [Oscillospiraceae bacterium]
MEETKSSGLLLRKQVSSPLLYRILDSLFVILLFAAIFLVVFNNQNTLYSFSVVRLFICAVSGCLLFYFAQRILVLLPAPPKLVEYAAFFLLFGLFIASLLYFGWGLKTLPDTGWSFGNVYNHAREYVLNGTQPGGYFSAHVEDTGLYVFLCMAFSVARAFGTTNFLAVGILLNTVAIAAAVLLLYITVRSAFGSTKGLIGLLFSLVVFPFVLYVPLFSAYTLAMPFVAAGVLLWQKSRRAWRSGETGGSMPSFVATILVCVLGSFLYFPAALVWVAICIDLLAFLRGKGRVWYLLLAVVLFVLLLGGMLLASFNSGLLPGYNYEQDGIPLNHYLYTGLDDNNAHYAQYSESALLIGSRQARYNHNGGLIQAKLSQMQGWGILAHLGNKLSYLLGDGTFSAPLSFAGGGVQRSSLSSLVVPGGLGFAPFAYAAFTVQVAMLFWAMVSGIKAVVYKNNYFSFVRIALLLVVLFLLVWQADPRSILPFLPLVLLCALEGGPIRPTIRPAMEKRPPRAKGEAPSLVDAVSLHASEYSHEFDDLLGETEKTSGSLYARVQGEEPFKTKPELHPAAETPQAPAMESQLPVARPSAAPKGKAAASPAMADGHKANGLPVSAQAAGAQQGREDTGAPAPTEATLLELLQKAQNGTAGTSLSGAAATTVPGPQNGALRPSPPPPLPAAEKAEVAGSTSQWVSLSGGQEEEGIAAPAKEGEQAVPFSGLEILPPQ